MQIRVAYRVDAHRYDPATGSCAADCRACALEAALYASAEEALAAQPPDERRRTAGDQGALVPPARRFELVVDGFV